MSDWSKGSTPPIAGWYWITVNDNEENRLINHPMYYDGHNWTTSKGYGQNEIIAFMICNKPSEPYMEAHIGFPSQYYIKAQNGDEIRYLSKGLLPVTWSKTGYSSKAKATAAIRRLRKAEPQLAETTVVNGNGVEV